MGALESHQLEEQVTDFAGILASPTYGMSAGILASPTYGMNAGILASPTYGMSAGILASPTYEMSAGILASPTYGMSAGILASPTYGMSGTDVNQIADKTKSIDSDSEESIDELCPSLRERCSWGSDYQDVPYDLPYQWRWGGRGSRDWTDSSEDENDGIERAFGNPTNEKHVVFKHGITKDVNGMGGKDNVGLQVENERLSIPSSVNHGNQTWGTKKDKYHGCNAGFRSSELEERCFADHTGEANFKTTGTHSFDYNVNFGDMIQRNSTHDTERKLRRFTEFVDKLDFESNHPRLVRNTDNAVRKEIKAPANWRIPKWKDLSDHLVIVKLNESDPVYGEIESLFLQNLPNVNITSIERIENGDLWENYMMKKSKMLQKKRKSQLEEKRVFHGTLNKNIPAICKQGFDPRLNGQTTGTQYGKGCYFAVDSSYSDSYAENGTNKSMFVAKILPGEYVCGKSSYRRPPRKDESDLSSDLYDSCVDNVWNPTIFVIFDNNQIYPEFLIRYTTN